MRKIEPALENVFIKNKTCISPEERQIFFDELRLK